MQREEVKSSQLVSIGYDAEKQILEIEFKAIKKPTGQEVAGAVYQYFEVPPETHKAIMDEAVNEGGSVGRYFGKEIRGKFKFAKLPPKEQAKEASAT